MMGAMDPAKPPRVLASRRQDEILRRIASDGSVSITDLAAFFDVSRETIRRDMKLLAQRGQLDLVHGGARSFASSEPAPPLRSQENAPGKLAIGRAAAALVEDGMVVFLDTGTSASAVANALIGKQNLTVFTTGLNIALLLCRQPGINVHIPGGEIEPQEEAILGSDVMDALGRLRIDMAFLGAGGVAPDGTITEFSRSGAELRSQIIDHAMQTWFLLDSSKFGRLTPMRIRNSARACGVIMDTAPPAPLRDSLRRRGMRVIVADSCK